jgi:hypothetical protein
MKPIFKRIALALVLGFIANWIVAWALAYIPHRFGAARFTFAQYARSTGGLPARGRFYVYDYRWFGVWEQQYSVQRRVSPSKSRSLKPGAMQFWWAWEPGAPSADFFANWHELSTEFQDIDEGMSTSLYSDMKFGWPALSVRSRGAINLSTSAADGSYTRSIEGALSVPIVLATKGSPMVQSVMIPYRPIWTGLAINTILYAALFWVLLSIKRAYRHARRMHKGRCPMCSYELEYSFIDGCPECGWRKSHTSVEGA